MIATIRTSQSADHLLMDHHTCPMTETAERTAR